LSVGASGEEYPVIVTFARSTSNSPSLSHTSFTEITDISNVVPAIYTGLFGPVITIPVSVSILSIETLTVPTFPARSVIVTASLAFAVYSFANVVSFIFVHPAGVSIGSSVTIVAVTIPFVTAVTSYDGVPIGTVLSNTYGPGSRGCCPYRCVTCIIIYCFYP